MSELTGNQGASLGEKMGPQSQRRLTLQERTQKLQSMATNTGRAKRKGGQSAIGGGIAFDPRKDCEICKPELQDAILTEVTTHSAGMTNEQEALHQP